LSFEIDDIKDSKELGEYLKNVREYSHISIEQIQKETKIRAKYIAAIEKGDFSAIPGGDVYIRGFLKLYADAVGLDSDTMIGLYKKIRGEPEKGDFSDLLLTDTTKLNDSAIKPRSYKKTGIIVFTAVFILFAILSIRVLKMRNSSQEPVVVPPITQNMPDEETEKSPVKDTIPVTEDREVMVEVIEDSRQKTVYIIDDDLIEVALNVTDNRCWISVIKDGTVDFEGTLSAGETKTWRAENKIDIRIGNPVVINLVINGKDLGNLKGQARNFVFERRT
jgi:cytoskeletal protein RodZ